MNKERVFMKVINQSDKKPAYFDMMGYVEKNMETSPYSEVNLRNNGIVKFDTDHYTVSFDAL